MSTQVEMAPESEKPARGDTTYVVQAAFIPSDTMGVVYAGPGIDTTAWADIAKVTVPPKSPRRKVIGLALQQSGIRAEQDSGPLRVRVLDVASAAETVVAAFQPDPEWRVG